MLNSANELAWKMCHKNVSVSDVCIAFIMNNSMAARLDDQEMRISFVIFLVSGMCILLLFKEREQFLNNDDCDKARVKRTSSCKWKNEAHPSKLKRYAEQGIEINI